jgi:hypothetical protein
MGLILQYSVEKVIQQINAASYQANDPYMDGFVTFGIKQDLYRIKWAAEEALKRCPVYVGEEEWLKEQEKKKIIRILKDESP